MSAWKQHKPICTAWKESREGYPDQTLCLLHSLPDSKLAPVAKAEMDGLNSRMTILFKTLRDEVMA